MAPTKPETDRFSPHGLDAGLLRSASKVKRPRTKHDGANTLTRTKKRRPRIDNANDAESIDLAKGLNHTIAKFDSSLLADYVAQRTKHFAPNLSHIELQDCRIPGTSDHCFTKYLRLLEIKADSYPETAFCNTSEWHQPRTLSNLCSFLERFVRRPDAKQLLSSSSERPGSPHTVSPCIATQTRILNCASFSD